MSLFTCKDIRKFGQNYLKNSGCELTKTTNSKSEPLHTKPIYLKKKKTNLKSFRL